MTKREKQLREELDWVNRKLSWYGDNQHQNLKLVREVQERVQTTLRLVSGPGDWR